MTDTNNGLRFKDFFSRVTNGEGFGQHIDKSIPGYAEHRNRLAFAVARSFPIPRVLDVGASEGQWGLAINEANPAARVVDLDPNPDMLANNVNPNSLKVLGAWVEGFEDNGVNIPAFDTMSRFDVVGMHMVRQFVTRDGSEWYKEAARVTRHDGVFLLSVKVVASEGHEDIWAANEKLKDAYKRASYTQEEMDAKSDEVLVGMHSLMMTTEEEEAELRKHFKYVAVIWKSANFRGYAASDSHEALLDIFFNYHS